MLSPLLKTLLCPLIILVQYGAATLQPTGRSLIFPATAPTRVQFIGGIGIPVEDLNYESITSGYVLKAEYFLPEKAEDFHLDYLRPQTIHRRSFNDSDQPAPKYRWILYKGVETLLDRGGLPGHICLLRSICEHAATPFHRQSGLMAEILHIVLTPTTSVDPVTKDTQKDYYRAERVGRYGGDRECMLRYKKCKKTPMHLISMVFDEFDGRRENIF